MTIPGLDHQLALGDFELPETRPQPAPPTATGAALTAEEAIFTDASQPVSRLTLARKAFHQQLTIDKTLSITADHVASNADKDQATSKHIAAAIATELNAPTVDRKLDGQRAGKHFENAVTRFLDNAMPLFDHIRPGPWRIENVGGTRGTYHVSEYEPFAHLAALREEATTNPLLASVLGNSYEISPDILVLREPLSDDVLNRTGLVVDENTGTRSTTRARNSTKELIHAVVSCKWTLRSDRAQNARSEALNIIRNRKGRTPHIVVVTGEPTPSRLASLALGTGDIDLVYHFALPELCRAVHTSGHHEAIAMLDRLLEGQRLRDISDLPLDLAV